MLVKELVSLNAPSGFEDEVREFIRNKVVADEIYTDSIGNLICRKKGAGKKIMICAHMDEVGLIITEITEKGFLRFDTLGAIDTSVLGNKKVIIGRERIPGIIGAKAIHLQDSKELKTPFNKKDLYIDIGAKDKDEAEKLVSQGDCAVFDGEYTPFGEHKIKAKALDDRVGCSILMELLKDSYDSDLYFVFSVQEEVGLRGAIIASHHIKPELALVIDGTTCNDVHGSKPHNRVTTLGGGAVMTAADRSAISDENFFNFIKTLANDNGIKLQIKRTTAGGTDAGAIQRSNCGVKTAVIAVPCKYIHSPISVLDINDYDNVYQLIKTILKNIEKSGL